MADASSQNCRRTTGARERLTSIVHIRDAFHQVVRYSAAAVIFVHNHPSGDPTPSKEACLPKPSAKAGDHAPAPRGR